MSAEDDPLRERYFGANQVESAAYAKMIIDTSEIISKSNKISNFCEDDHFLVFPAPVCRAAPG
jgi:hypothetical protein